MKTLPKVLFKDKWYFVDSRLWQIRNVFNPHEFIDIDDITSEELMDKVTDKLAEENIFCQNYI